VHTTADGTFDIIDIGVRLYLPGRGMNVCSSPVPEKS
jgi:hypothetical protein